MLMMIWKASNSYFRCSIAEALISRVFTLWIIKNDIKQMNKLKLLKAMSVDVEFVQLCFLHLITP